jgi:hypothetical protein
LENIRNDAVQNILSACFLSTVKCSEVYFFDLLLCMGVELVFSDQGKTWAVGVREEGAEKDT